MKINRYSAVEALRKGKVIVLPTDTVYGLGCMCNSEQAANRIYDLKNRDRRKPLILFVSNLKQVKDLACNIPQIAKELMNKFWPGPLTIILRAKENIPISQACIFKTDNFNTISFRIPNHPIPRFLVKELGVPLATTSANISGYNYQATSVKILERIFENKVDLCIDDNEMPTGIESTVIDCSVSPPSILREGALASQIKSCLTRFQ
ncbi:threonylcarbamoyl-AMP synthase [bacterium]|nr:threonylcarbamoyl-AMP synthase [bacterium]